MSRPGSGSYFGVDTVPRLSRYVETPEIPVVMKTILVQGRELPTYTARHDTTKSGGLLVPEEAFREIVPNRNSLPPPAEVATTA